MIPFAAPVDDILFSLTNVARAGELPDFDADLHAEIAGHFAAFAEGVVAPLNGPGDAQGARLLDGRVRMPDGFRDAFAQFREQGWPGLAGPEAFGGQDLGAPAHAVLTEILAGANQSFETVVNLAPGAVRVLMTFGTEAQQARNIPPLVAGDWLSTMALTEPGAGSDLSRIRTRATRQGDGWRIDGEKIFITGGDHDLTDATFHLVLARTSNDGIRGLSLFLCRSDREDGSRNGIAVTRIEEKLGLHASPTCQLSFDAAEAELVGQEGAGLLAMFTMMNHARLTVALQGVAQAARACAIARAYAAERVQGKDTVIAAHPDVARMLDEMALRAMGARGIAHLAVVALQAEGDSPLVDLLTPVAKYVCTEVGSEVADIGVQVLGGYGYLEEYGLSQVLRDARICRIYEGANGIHALSLATRSLRQPDQLAALQRLAKDCAALPPWQDRLAVMQAADDPRALADVFMRLTGELVHQVVWDRIAAAAGGADRPDLARLAPRARGRMALAIAAFDAEAALHQA